MTASVSWLPACQATTWSSTCRSINTHLPWGVRGVVTNVNLGGYATVQGIELVDDTLSNVRFGAHGATSGDRTVVRESVRNVTDSLVGAG